MLTPCHISLVVVVHTLSGQRPSPLCHLKVSALDQDLPARASRSRVTNR